MSYFPFWSLFRVLYRGFLFVFSLQIWFLNRLVYIFSANSARGRKQLKNARRDKSAVFMENKKSSFLMLCLLNAFSPACTEELLASRGAAASSCPAPAPLGPHWFMSRESEWWKSPQPLSIPV